MQIAFIGLGQMGRPMALNMLKAVPGMLVRATGTPAFHELQAAGAAAMTSPAEIAPAEVVFLCLPDEQVVQEMLFSDAGIAGHLRPGSIVVDTSTIGYTDTLAIAHRLQERGIHLIDAPVSGMSSRAVDGTLTAMCGGAEPVFETVRPLLDHIASNVIYMGACGAGQLAKLINQLLFDINCAALAELLPMAVKRGLDPEKMSTIVNTGTGRSYASEFFLPRILDDGFTDGYLMRNAYKDLVSGAELGARTGVPLPVLAAATATYQTALLQGYGDLDKGAMIKVFETLLEVRFRRKSH